MSIIAHEEEPQASELTLNSPASAKPARGGPRFGLGRLVMTIGAREALDESGEPPFKFIARHVSGDWGELEPEDKAENELSIREGFRILSHYRTSKGVRLYVITEADRRATTLLLPEEY